MYSVDSYFKVKVLVEINENKLITLWQRQPALASLKNEIIPQSNTKKYLDKRFDHLNLTKNPKF